MSFNDLNDKEIEVLSLLAEEAAEVIQGVSKILRHGLYNVDPTIPHALDNIEHLCKELGDMEAAKSLCSKYIYEFNELVIKSAKVQKLQRINKWLHHASSDGIPK